MKSILKRFYLAIFLLLFCAITVWADGHKVLFIGNSYTSVNNLPEVIKQMALSHGDTLEYTANAPGGCTFAQHLNNQSATYIQQGGWDYIVLQEQSQLPSFPDNQFYNECYPYAQQLCQMAAQYNPEAKVVFYMTWGRKNGDSQNCQYFPPLCTYEGMDSLLYNRYMEMAEDNEAWVSPVGRLWHYLRDNYPEIELYSSDESHPTTAGTYAAACSFYAILFGNDPSHSSYTFGLSESVAQTIQEAAKRVVYDSLDKWTFTDPTSINLNTSTENIRIWPNPTTDFVNISSAETLKFIDLYSIEGKLLKHQQFADGEEYTLSLIGLTSGIYFIQVADNKNNKNIFKLIKR